MEDSCEILLDPLSDCDAYGILNRVDIALLLNKWGPLP